MAEFNINGQNYRTAKIDAMRQFHLSRKVAPIIPALIPLFTKLAASQGAEGEDANNPLSSDLDGLASLLEPFAEALANMADETAEYIMSTCLSVVSRQQGSAWNPIWSDRQKVCMFDDIDTGVMFQIAAAVVRESLGPFLVGLLSSSAARPPAQA